MVYCHKCKGLSEKNGKIVAHCEEMGRAAKEIHSRYSSNAAIHNLYYKKAVGEIGGDEREKSQSWNETEVPS